MKRAITVEILQLQPPTSRKSMTEWSISKFQKQKLPCSLEGGGAPT